MTALGVRGWAVSSLLGLLHFELQARDIRIDIQLPLPIAELTPILLAPIPHLNPLPKPVQIRRNKILTILNNLPSQLFIKFPHKLSLRFRRRLLYSWASPCPRWMRYNF